MPAKNQKFACLQKVNTALKDYLLGNNVCLGIIFKAKISVFTAHLHALNRHRLPAARNLITGIQTLFGKADCKQQASTSNSTMKTT